MELGHSHKWLAGRYGRAVVHLRNQYRIGRFGLILGAGVSRDFGIPNWSALISAIAEDERVNGRGVLDTLPKERGLPYATEVLFEVFCERMYRERGVARCNKQLDSVIAATWRKVVKKHLYDAVDGSFSVEKLKGHPYFESLLPLVRNIQMTVTYNFDDLLESALSLTRGEQRAKGYEIVTNPWSQFRRDRGVIYHPNGVIPRNDLEAPSDTFVFSEASYVERMVGIYAGDQSGLIGYLSRNTCLLIGTSLDDETLRNALGRAARACPGNYHYYVRYVEDGEHLNDEQINSVRMANFNVYNLITLFLKGDQIASLCQMVGDQGDSNQFCNRVEEIGEVSQYVYYVTGPLAVGKSTAINNFRNLSVFEEWLAERPEVLGRDWRTLTDVEKAEADGWIADQFKKKNEKLKDNREGVFFLDRGPLDPLAFETKERRAKKASELRKTLCPNNKWRVVPGVVIFLDGDPEDLVLRVVASGREQYTAERLKEMTASLREVYGNVGVAVVDTRGLSASDVAKRIAKIIHIDERYEPADLHLRLREIGRSKA